MRVGENSWWSHFQHDENQPFKEMCPYKIKPPLLTGEGETDGNGRLVKLSV